jgi:hypothetical protein
MKNNFEKISVICALFIGNRAVQVDNIINNKLYYFQKQLEYLEKYKNKIFKFYFVVTFENENYFEKYKDILNDYNNDIINISFKQNLGGSYTSWKFGLELDNGQLVWQPTKVIYKGKGYPAPVFLTTLQSVDYIVNLLRTGEWKNR